MALKGEPQPGNQLQLLLVDVDPERCDGVRRQLANAQLAVTVYAVPATALLQTLDRFDPDVILIDMASPNRDLLESLSFISAHAPKPIVLFSQQDDPSTISDAVDVGVSTYLVGDLEPAKVRPVIDVALAQFRAMESLRDALAATRVELNEQRLIDRAKSRLMEAHDLSEQDAYGVLRSQAMKQNMKIVDVAQRVLGLIAGRETRP